MEECNENSDEEILTEIDLFELKTIVFIVLSVIVLPICTGSVLILLTINT